MSLATVYTRAKCGIDAPLVRVEVHLSNGLPALSIVGLPETAVRESKDRVRSAIINSHFEFPSRRVTINLAPADLPKEGGRFDLAIAIGILAASKQLPNHTLETFEFLGELGLTGELHPVQGALAAAIKSSKAERALVVPAANTDEATLCEEATIFSCNNLLQLSAHLHNRELLTPQRAQAPSQSSPNYPDLSEVKGQALARRALEIAAAGNHNLLFCGPPGTGKTMLASRLPGILPPLNQQEMLEVAAVYSISQQSSPRHYYQRPFRNPHHTASPIALVGGGSSPRPGEISLANHGVLFLDELPEFQRRVLEVLREPLESGEILISRANQQLVFPANFQLIAAMNPCPCGYYGDLHKACRCSPDQLRRYRDKISGPLLDRIDMQVTVNRLPVSALRQQQQAGEASATVLKRVMRCRDLQQQRQQCTNSRLDNRLLELHCPLSEKDHELLELAVMQWHLSPRAYHRILRVARTIADLAAAVDINSQHLTEAMSYRALDKEQT
ncbi:YifB family Mg chelatase-like AAA ATPase [Oceanicoccus sagamiensis]|uniref:ATP-dependent protease n=1 Tax=Oceanicoccus sagamiensis TaxID=716816 RepID=A0A1X9NJG9_9GAMM|nr:YifB family Mg chelatase-like AAA ATPase [Oceanicoccus sagamiensis]ARN74133.1 ATP-dependent protease [Oceanicoccus sagamiensis]